MNDVIENSKFDTIKWFFVWIALASGLFANYFFAELPVSVRLIGWLLLSLLIFGIISQTRKGKTWWFFIEQARNELKKIVWSTRQEVVQTTLVVAFMVVFAALFLWVTDSLLMKCIQFFTGK